MYYMMEMSTIIIIITIAIIHFVSAHSPSLRLNVIIQQRFQMRKKARKNFFHIELKRNEAYPTRKLGCAEQHCRHNSSKIWWYLRRKTCIIAKGIHSVIPSHHTVFYIYPSIPFSRQIKSSYSTDFWFNQSQIFRHKFLLCLSLSATLFLPLSLCLYNI